MERCPSGHFYDPAKHMSCPHCGIADLDIGPTVAKGGFTIAPTIPANDSKTMPAGGRRSDEGATVGYFDKKIGIEPVVGWLVCVEGPDRGRDYRIRSRRNFIGRDTRMDICISSDTQISRENHAVISYDPRNNSFKLVPGDSRGITYLNGETVDVPVPIKAYDRIELGETQLLFVPFCGDQFKWQ